MNREAPHFTSELQLIEHYLGEAEAIQSDDQNASGSAQTPPATLKPANDDRDRRLYEVGQDVSLTWSDVADIVNKEFPGEVLDKKSAGMAAKRHQKRCKLPSLPQRKTGSKPQQ